ncbi:MAG: Beta-lactamase and rhodanese domain protein [Candidatus Uhrbacteria bacterium GW2011_GWF2_41_16]|uniref:Beta-lactamase and rhodanese domain protein n=1 Tax=Candidatus Uhrbacteria bacterium GW2011_GWF2_41_16 TaxID=1618997 RepID=A0A0G0VAY8_9BACT|nr:MAG: Beta-lactamase and rhodanese domain protein [Candidatus Uhrbacteria bacterium GW2011_GWF2_41_16]
MIITQTERDVKIKQTSKNLQNEASVQTKGCKMKAYIIRQMSIVIILLSSCSLTLQAAIKDAESATHGDNAASYQIVDTYEFDGFKLIQINLPVLSHYSYFLVSDNKVLVVDPGRDIDFYINLIKEQSLSVAGVFLTHSHADFVAGHMEMVKAFNCPIYQSAKSNAKYKIEPIADGTTIQVGQAKVQFLDTPGHVVDGTSAIVFSPGKTQPELILTGDYLFVGGVGRPDLVTGTTSSALAGMLFDTWKDKISKLPDSVKVFPAHGAGSLCGANLKDSPSSTIGEERTSNPYLLHTIRAEFITTVLSDLQEPPQYFGYNAAMNRNGPELVDWQKPIESVNASEALTDSAKFYVADIRDAKDFASGHIPGSINIGVRGRFEAWTGIMVPWGSNLILCGDGNDFKEAVHRLHRVGYTAKTISYNVWQQANLPQLKNNPIAPQQLYKQMASENSPVVVDVRLPNEWMGLRIGTVLNLPLNHLSDLSAKLDKTQPVVTVCNSAYRSSMAIGVLERKGFANVTSMAGGSEAWVQAGLPVYGAETKNISTSAAKKVIPLPERISADELKRMIMDTPGTFDLVDIRPAEHFKDYSLPGSTNVEIAELIGNQAYLTGAGPLIIVDRDGSLAMAAAGILSQKTQRPVKALYGGLEKYWQDNGMDLGSTPKTPQQTAPSKPMPSSPTEQKPQTPKKKSAGC